jgi:glutaminyl-tRNA synthetase
MPTLSGIRRRGYTPQAVRTFCERIGVSKANSLVDYSMLEFCVREDLNRTAPRAMAVLDPVRVVIENVPENAVEWLEAENNPEDESAGTRKVPFSREIFIERDDFMENPPKKFFRLAPGQEVRLKHAYYVTCTDVIRDHSGEVQELRCTYDPETRGGWSKDGRKIKGTLHWVSAAHAVPVEVRLYENLFRTSDPAEGPDGDFRTNINPDSLRTVQALAEPALKDAAPGQRFQFLRHGYFCADSKDSKPGAPVFNRTVGLKDSWAKEQKKG